MEPVTRLTKLTESETTAGNYFVSNYPPYSFWTPDRVGEACAALKRRPTSSTPLGIYAHIPFCRKRCHFCYFKVYTEKKAAEIQDYLQMAIRELTIYSRKPFIDGRKPTFIYFGGGTPSFISSRDFSQLAEDMKKALAWSEAEEITFECEPGTLTANKLKVIKEVGVTRLSLGIENFNERILRLNGRAHGAKEIDRAYHLARWEGFPQINIDLIAGMVGETTENWRNCVAKTLSLSPDSVTIYQMEIPHNTTIFEEMKTRGQRVAPVAKWATKRKWVNLAFSQLEAAGYSVTSAYTAVKDPIKTRFLYRDLLWKGADLIGLGVASFSHIGGTHFQNEHEMASYTARLAEGRLPIYRALTPTREELMIRELILQLKLGQVDSDYFQNKFGVDISRKFARPLHNLQKQSLLKPKGSQLRLSRDGLLQVDRLLPEFFLPKHRHVRFV